MRAALSLSLAYAQQCSWYREPGSTHYYAGETEKRFYYIYIYTLPKHRAIETLEKFSSCLMCALLLVFENARKAFRCGGDELLLEQWKIASKYLWWCDAEIVVPTYASNQLACSTTIQSVRERANRTTHIARGATHTHTRAQHNPIHWRGMCVCVWLWLRSGRVHVHRRNLWHSQLLSNSERKSLSFASRRWKKKCVKPFPIPYPTPRPPSKLIVWLRRDPFICFVNFTTQYDDKCIGKVEGES